MTEPALAMISYADYLAIERESDLKHEYLDGVVRAMAGGPIEHSRLATNFASELRLALAGRPCAAFSSDGKIRLDASNRATYPDVSVVSGRLERSEQDPDAITNPIVLVEVLSESTEAYDRGEKFRHYRRLTSLREYVLVSQHEPLVEVFARDGDAWRVFEYGPGDTIQLPSVGASITVDALYADPLTS